MSWHVLYTRSRCEKVVALRLKQLNIEVFCPLVKRRKLWSDRIKIVEEPLFSSYCFVNINDAVREKVLFVPGVVKYVYHCGKPAVVRDKDMEVLSDWLSIYEHDSIEVGRLNASDKVIIHTGALKEKSAEVLEAKGNHAILYLEDMGFQVRVDLRKNLLEKIN